MNLGILVGWLTLSRGLAKGRFDLGRKLVIKQGSDHTYRALDISYYYLLILNPVTELK